MEKGKVAKKTATVEPEKKKKKLSYFDQIMKNSGIVIPPVNELNELENVYFIDTGSYVLNALISGSLFGGIPSDCITGLAGEGLPQERHTLR